MKIALVACCKKKRAEFSVETAAQVIPGDGNVTGWMAREMYASDLFEKSSAWADAFCDGWLILSAKYGPIHPRKMILPYDLTMRDHNPANRRKWAKESAEVITMSYNPNAILVILAGRDYRDPLVPLLEAAGFQIEVPMQGLGIGQQKAWLKRELINIPKGRN